MRLLYFRLFSVLLLLVLLADWQPAFAQMGRAAKRAALKTRNKQISRFTVRTDFSKSKKYISFGGGVGISNYFGDLAPNNTRVSTNLGYTRSYLTGYYLQRVHPNVTIRGALSWMTLRGDDYSVANATSPDWSDLGRYTRNLSFRNNIFELSGVGLFELFPTDRGYLRRNFFNPYGLLGLSIFTHNPQTKTPQTTKGPKSDWVDLRPLGTEGQLTGIAGTPKMYSLIQIGVPIGLGFRYRLLDKFDLSLELGYRFVFTDYIDDVSGRYPSEEVYKEMYDAGNYQGIMLSNRSAETFAAIEGQNRVSALSTISRAFKLTERAKIYKNINDHLLYRNRQEYFLRTNPGDTLSDLELQNPANYLPNPDYPNTLENQLNTSIPNKGENANFRRVKGNEYGAAPRGNKRRDYWLVTALHLSYILEIKQKPPKFR